ncbi:MAG: hypothetical protein A3I04_01475 [Nitrospinae bacterium RIFCSPLOWO2_02_FULL_39_110]|nr:MAG: hypothetical protein A3I04_01475 [Nitrospinae bacterium RIFCSPLOWO2_02_FULL_39_110]
MLLELSLFCFLTIWVASCYNGLFFENPIIAGESRCFNYFFSLLCKIKVFIGVFHSEKGIWTMIDIHKFSVSAVGL